MIWIDLEPPMQNDVAQIEIVDNPYLSWTNQGLMGMKRWFHLFHCNEDEIDPARNLDDNDDRGEGEYIETKR